MNVVKQRIYIDTSVVGGYFATMFAKDTIPFFDSVKKGEVKIIVSEILEAELLRAPVFVRELMASISSKHIEKVKLTQEAILLADKYIAAKVVGKTSRADCQHIAIATISKADVLVSWNFKHIVNLDRIRGTMGLTIRWVTT